MADPAPRFDAIVSDFETGLTTLGNVIQHIIDSQPSRELEVLMLNNTIVALTATIEEGLRDLFKEYLSFLEENFEDHRKLRMPLQKANLDCAIQELKKHKNNSDLKVAARLVSNLNKCLDGQRDYRILKDRISYNQGNFKSKQVTEISKSIGLDKLWHGVCDCPEVEEYTGETNIDTRVTRLTAHWNNVFEERDTVVHRISRASGWSADRILQSLELSKLVFKRIAIFLATDANDLVSRSSESGPAKGPTYS